MLRYRGTFPKGSNLATCEVNLAPLQGKFNGARITQINYSLREKVEGLTTFACWGGKGVPNDPYEMERSYNLIYGTFVTDVQWSPEGYGLDSADTLIVLGNKFNMVSWSFGNLIPACWFEVIYEQVALSDENEIVLRRKNGLQLDFSYGIYPGGQG
jgi:hypothetical protein